MLRLLLELQSEIGIVLSLVHFNHGLRGAESDGDEQFVRELAARYRLPFHCEAGDVAAHSAKDRLSLEAAARELRYGYFNRLLAADGLNRIATAHTLDDQAETVLMRVTRGAGTRGLAGIYPQLAVAGSQFAGDSRKLEKSIVRPLLGVRRQEVERYLKTISQGWREDGSNLDLQHARNRVRHGILPMLEKDLNPAVREALSDAAEIARVEEEYWDGELGRSLPTAWSDSDKSLRINALKGMPLALQRRVIRGAAQTVGLSLEFRQVEEILEVCGGSRKSAQLTGGWRAVRRRDGVRFEQTNARDNAPAKDYAYQLPVPGVVLISEAGLRFEAELISLPSKDAREIVSLLDVRRLTTELIVRNWRPGDRFWPLHGKNPKKIKELLQEKH